MIPYKQLALAEVFEDCQNKFDNDKYQFLSLLDQTINLDEIVPVSFVTHFHASTGRPRKHPLYPMIKALLIQRIFSIPTDTLLIIFLKYSQELRDFCGFRVVPDASKFTRFKQDFLMDLQSMFEAHNFDKNFDPYKAAYGSMPAHATANPAIQQMYINGHFCYAYKFGIVTNGLGIVRDITFYNKDFLNAHPNIIVEKKSDSPDEDKSLADSKALLPVLIDFFQKHPLINPKTFLGDAAFDTIEIYKALLDDLGFEKAFIPLRTKLSMEENGYTFNENGVPCCPHDSTLPMKREGSKSHLRSKLPSMKFVCPKMKWEYNRETKTKRRVCRCENPCTTSSCGRMIYIYPEKNLRAYPGVERGSVEWDETYKIRVNVEKSINHFKDSFCIAGRCLQEFLS